MTPAHLAEIRKRSEDEDSALRPEVFGDRRELLATIDELRDGIIEIARKPVATKVNLQLRLESLLVRCGLSART